MVKVDDAAPTGLSQDGSLIHQTSTDQTPAKKLGFFGRFFSSNAKNAPEIAKKSTSTFGGFGEWYQARKQKASSKKINASQDPTTVASTKPNFLRRMLSCFNRGTKAEITVNLTPQQTKAEFEAVMKEAHAAAKALTIPPEPGESASSSKSDPTEDFVEKFKRTKKIKNDKAVLSPIAEKINKKQPLTVNDLSSLLRTKHGDETFKSYAEKNHSMEIYYFPKACLAFENLCQSGASIEEIRQKYSEIHELFIKQDKRGLVVGEPRLEVNVSGPIAQEARALLEDGSIESMKAALKKASDAVLAPVIIVIATNDDGRPRMGALAKLYS